MPIILNNFENYSHFSRKTKLSQSSYDILAVLCPLRYEMRQMLLTRINTHTKKKNLAYSPGSSGGLGPIFNSPDEANEGVSTFRFRRVCLGDTATKLELKYAKVHGLLPSNLSNLFSILCRKRRKPIKRSDLGLATARVNH